MAASLAGSRQSGQSREAVVGSGIGDRHGLGSDEVLQIGYLTGLGHGWWKHGFVQSTALLPGVI